MLLARVVRRSLALAIWLAIRHRVVLLALAGLLLLGWLGLPYLSSSLAPAGIRTSGPADGQTSAEGRVASVENYIRGMFSFDAKLMWDSFSDETKTEMISRGATVEALQSSLDEGRKAGVRYEGAAYIGAHVLGDGRQYVFYVLTARGIPGASSASEQFYVFTVDRDGRIATID